MSKEFTPLDCKWCYWENHVTTDESCLCLVDACLTGDPKRVFALACYDENEGCPCDCFERIGNVDMQYAKELIASKYRYYERKAKR